MTVKKKKLVRQPTTTHHFEKSSFTIIRILNLNHIPPEMMMGQTLKTYLSNFAVALSTPKEELCMNLDSIIVWLFHSEWRTSSS